MSDGILYRLRRDAYHGDWFIRWLLGAIVLLFLSLVGLAVYGAYHFPLHFVAFVSLFAVPYIIGKVLAEGYGDDE